MQPLRAIQGEIAIGNTARLTADCSCVLIFIIIIPKSASISEFEPTSSRASKGGAGLCFPHQVVITHTQATKSFVKCRLWIAVIHEHSNLITGIGEMLIPLAARNMSNRVGLKTVSNKTVMCQKVKYTHIDFWGERCMGHKSVNYMSTTVCF